jgi:hypothetical protein
MTKKFADDRKPHSASRTNARERMTDVMYAKTLESKAPRYGAPSAVQVRAWFFLFHARIVADNHVVAH